MMVNHAIMGIGLHGHFMEIQGTVSVRDKHDTPMASQQNAPGRRLVHEEPRVACEKRAHGRTKDMTRVGVTHGRS